MLVGFCEVDVAGLAPGKDHVHELGEFVLRSVKLTQAGVVQKIVSLAEKFATGGEQVVTVIKILFEGAGEPVTQGSAEVILTETKSPFDNAVEVKEGEFVPAFTPFTCH